MSEIIAIPWLMGKNIINKREMAGTGFGGLHPCQNVCWFIFNLITEKFKFLLERTS